MSPLLRKPKYTRREKRCSYTSLLKDLRKTLNSDDKYTWALQHISWYTFPWYISTKLKAAMFLTQQNTIQTLPDHTHMESGSSTMGYTR
jgi:hypothetical protein